MSDTLIVVSSDPLITLLRLKRVDQVVTRADAWRAPVRAVAAARRGAVVDAGSRPARGPGR